MKTAFAMSASAATVYIDGQSYVFAKTHPNFTKAVAAVKAKLWDTIPGLLDLSAAMTTISDRVSTLNGVVFFDDLPMPAGYLLNRITKANAEGLSLAPLAHFMEKYAANPSTISRDEALEFFDKCNLPLAPDGDFLAWKVVREDFTDKHTGKFDNSVGQTLFMARNLVDPDRNVTCSSGFHVCSKDYIKDFRRGDNKLVMVKVNPADVVSIPADHQNQKMRVTGYTVVREATTSEIAGVEGRAYHGDVPTRDIPEPHVIAAVAPRGFIASFRRFFGV